MITVYINYPKPHFTLHSDPSCVEVHKQRKTDQRKVRVNRSTMSSELDRFAGKYYGFAAQASLNDIWLEVDFDHAEFERAVVGYIRRLLGDHYAPFAHAPIAIHKCLRRV
jgi:hypothetical protein